MSDLRCWCSEVRSSTYWSGRWIQDEKTYHLVSCIACGTIRTDLKMCVHYPENYLYERADGRIAQTADLVSSVAGKSLVVDIGCNTGLLVRELQRRGVNACGYDTDAVAINRGREKAGRIYLGDIDVAAATHSKVGTVVLNHTLEHIPEPAHTIRTAASMLPLGGSLIVCVPNILSFRARLRMSDWGPLIPHEHLWHFSRRTLVDCVTRPKDFELVRCHTRDIHYLCDPTGIVALKARLRRTIAVLGCGEELCATFRRLASRQ